MKKTKKAPRKTIISPKLASMMRRGIDPRLSAKVGYK